MKSPLISIITVTFNNLKGLTKTIESCGELNDNIHEHIVIDGGSTDGSNQFLEQITLPLFNYISEADNGIYDAMNKGIAMAKGNWIIFMNAGDLFYSKNTLANIEFPTEPAIIYGNSEVRYDSGFNRQMQASSLQQFWKGLPFSHQSVFVHSSLFNKGFNTTYRFCADFDLIYGLFISGRKFVRLNETLGIISAGGVSDNKRYIATTEVYNISRSKKSGLKLHFYFIPKIIGSFIIVKLKVLMPKKIMTLLYKIKYK